MSSPDVRFVHVTVQAPAQAVYAYAQDPRNLPRWAPNFGHSISRDGDCWVMETADGPVSVRFAPPNRFGILDHWVTLAGGEIHNPIRVVPHGAGSLVVFTLFRQDGWSDAQLDEDVALVLADLERLKAHVEAAESI